MNLVVKYNTVFGNSFSKMKIIAKSLRDFGKFDIVRRNQSQSILTA